MVGQRKLKINGGGVQGKGGGGRGMKIIHLIYEIFIIP